MALVTLLGFLPTLVLSVPAGVLADRFDRRLLMVTHDSRMASRCGRILYLVDGQIQGELSLGDEIASLKEREERVGSWLTAMNW